MEVYNGRAICCHVALLEVNAKEIAAQQHEPAHTHTHTHPKNMLP